MVDQLTGYIKKNKDSYVNELKEYLSIPSISTTKEYKKDMNRCAVWVMEKLNSAGLAKVEILETEGHPLVYGEWMGAPGKPTVLIYGHYDVQPVDPLNLLKSHPFEPVVKGG